MYQPSNASGKLVATTFAQGLDNFTFDHNLFWAGSAAASELPLFNATSHGAESFSDWQAHGKDAGSLLEDPKFTAPYQLSKDSPAVAKLGFIPIDLSRVGPRAAAVGAADVRLSATGVHQDAHVRELATLGLVRH